MDDGGKVAFIVNWSNKLIRNFTVKISDTGVLPTQGDLVYIKDLWLQKTIGTFTDNHSQLNLTIPVLQPHGNQMFYLSIVPKPFIQSQL